MNTSNRIGYIYKYTNLINGKIYIGKTYRLNIHKQEHKYSKSDTYFHKALNKYGFENFKFEVIAQTDNDKTLIFLERYYIRKFNSFRENGYNLTLGGEGTLGYNFSEEQKKKMSEVRKGRVVTDETKMKISLSGKGKHNHKGENNPNWKGVKKEKEYVPREIINKHISEAKKGCTPWNKGKEHTKEAKEKMSIAAQKRKELHLHWYNNGKEEQLASEFPFGYIKGRLKKINI